MSKLITIDVGGTSIKYALWDTVKQQLSNQNSIPTPKSLKTFYQAMLNIVQHFSHANIAGIGFSMPGAVNQKTGIIQGISAIPYIHNFPIKEKLENLLQYPVSIANDANCAALAEVAVGVAKDLHNVLFIIIGTGIGGAIVVNRQIIPGKHLYGGEFGMMLIDGQQLSSIGTVVHLADRYNQQQQTQFTGQQVLSLAQKGDLIAQKESQLMFNSLAQAIYNLQYCFDPEQIIIGGGVSQNSYFFDCLNDSLKRLVKKIDLISLIPQITPAQYYNDANLIGAAANFYQNKS